MISEVTSSRNAIAMASFSGTLFKVLSTKLQWYDRQVCRDDLGFFLWAVQGTKSEGTVLSRVVRAGSVQGLVRIRKG
jgi:hypothetical protein